MTAMSRGNERIVDASVDTVWAVLADGWTYATWVVGASRIRSVDPSWPVAGSSIHHSVGVWPAVLDDRTSVVSVRAKRELQLRAKAFPFGTAHITLELEQHGTGCRVRMIEHAAHPPHSWIPDAVQHAAVYPRNAEALRRLALLAERRTG